MPVRILVAVVLVAVAAVAARPARAQTLADVARKEAERRKEVKEPPKTFTNDDLQPAGPASSAPSAATADKDKSKDGKDADVKGGDAAKDKGTNAAKDAGAAKDQTYWGAKMKTLTDRLDQDHVLADAMQTRVNALTTDFVNRDDPAQRNVIGENKQKALDELARLQKAIVDDTKAIADLEEEARRAGVPPGWLR
jgi:hypothetical protein